MLLTSHQIERSCEHSLNNVLGFSGACFDAGQRVLELLTDARSESFNRLGAGQVALESATVVRIIDRIYEIAGDTHKAMIESTEVQIGIMDMMLFAAIDRVSQGVLAWKAVRATVASAEQTLLGISNGGIQAVESVEQDVHQVGESLAEKKPRRSVAAGSRKKTQ